MSGGLFLPVSFSLISKCITWANALSLLSPGSGSLFFLYSWFIFASIFEDTPGIYILPRASTRANSAESYISF